MSGESFRNFAAITPSDTVKIAPTVGIYVGTTGDLTVVGREGLLAAPVTFTAVPAGMTLWIEVVYVMATNTTATNMVALR